MVEILAAATETVVQGPSALQTWGPWGAVIIALGGPKGVAKIISLWQGKGANCDRSDRFDKAACNQRHEQIEKDRLQDREDIRYIRDKIDSLVAMLMEKK